MRRPEPDADDSSSSVPATSASIAASTSGTSGTRKWRLRPKSFVRKRSAARRRPRAELVVVGPELARDEPRLGFRDVGVVRVVEQDDAPGVLADAAPGPGAAEVARGRLRRVAEVRVVRADQDERLDALALAEPHGRRGPAAVAHDDGLLVDAEPAQEGHPPARARDVVAPRASRRRRPAHVRSRRPGRASSLAG